MTGKVPLHNSDIYTVSQKNNHFLCVCARAALYCMYIFRKMSYINETKYCCYNMVIKQRRWKWRLIIVCWIRVPFVFDFTIELPSGHNTLVLRLYLCWQRISFVHRMNIIDVKCEPFQISIVLCIKSFTSFFGFSLFPSLFLSLLINNLHNSVWPTIKQSTYFDYRYRFKVFLHGIVGVCEANIRRWQLI